MNLDGRTKLPSGAGFPLAVLVIGAVSISCFAVRVMVEARAADGWVAALAWVGASLFLVTGLVCAALAVIVAVSPYLNRRAAPSDPPMRDTRDSQHPARNAERDAEERQPPSTPTPRNPSEENRA